MAPTIAAVGTFVSGVAATSSTHSFGKPSGVVVGSMLVALYTVEHNGSGTQLAAPSGWAAPPDAPAFQAVANGTALYVWWKYADATDADAGTTQYAMPVQNGRWVRGGIVRIVDHATSSPWDAGDGAVSASSTSAPSTSVTTTGADRLLIWMAGSYDVSAWGTMPASFTEHASWASGTSVVNTLATRTVASASTVTTGAIATGASNGKAAWLGAIKPAAATPTAPTVSAGADVTDHVVDTEFARTATENANGATITSRAWTIQAGPTGVGTTIGTAAALSWTPTVTGTYTLRYAATNSAGTGTDDMTIEVVAAPAAPGQVFDLSRWHLTLPTEDPGPDTDAAQIDQPALATYTDSNFYVDASGDVVFNAPVNGATTSGESGATRCELREHEAGSYANSAWDPLTTGRRQLTVCCRVDGTSIDGTVNGADGRRQEVIFFQIHGATGTPPIYLTAEWTSSGNAIATPRVRMFVSGTGLSNTNLVSPISPTADIAVRCRVESAVLKLWCVLGTEADLPAIDTTPTFTTACSNFTDKVDWYFKHGSYNKTLITSGSTGEAVVTTSFVELLQPGDVEGATTYDRTGAAGAVVGTSGTRQFVEHAVYDRTGAAGVVAASSGAVELAEPAVRDREGAAGVVVGSAGTKQRLRSYAGAAGVVVGASGVLQLDQHAEHDRVGATGVLVGSAGTVQLDEPVTYDRSGAAGAVVATSGVVELDAVNVYDRAGASGVVVGTSGTKQRVRSYTGAAGIVAGASGAVELAHATTYDRTGASGAVVGARGTCSLGGGIEYSRAGASGVVAGSSGAVDVAHPATYDRSGASGAVVAASGAKQRVRSYSGASGALAGSAGAVEHVPAARHDRGGASGVVAGSSGVLDLHLVTVYERSGAAGVLAGAAGTVQVDVPDVYERSGAVGALVGASGAVALVPAAVHVRTGGTGVVVGMRGRVKLGDDGFHVGRPRLSSAPHAGPPRRVGTQHAAAPYVPDRHHAGVT